MPPLEVPFMLAGSGLTDLVTWILYPERRLDSLAFSNDKWRTNLCCLSAASSLIKNGVWSAKNQNKHDYVVLKSWNGNKLLAIYWCNFLSMRKTLVSWEHYENVSQIYHQILLLVFFNINQNSNVFYHESYKHIIFHSHFMHRFHMKTMHTSLHFSSETTFQWTLSQHLSIYKRP